MFVPIDRAISFFLAVVEVEVNAYGCCLHPEDGGDMLLRNGGNYLKDTWRHNPEERDLHHGSARNSCFRLLTPAAV